MLGIILFMKRVVGHVVGANIFPDVFPSPIREWIHLYESKFFVPLNFLGIRASGSLIAANPGGPRGEVAELGLERLDLAQVAAFVRIDGPEFRPELLGLFFRRKRDFTRSTVIPYFFSIFSINS